MCSSLFSFPSWTKDMNGFEWGEDKGGKDKKRKRMMKKWHLTSCLEKHNFICKRSGKIFSHYVEGALLIVFSLPKSSFQPIVNREFIRNF